MEKDFQHEQPGNWKWGIIYYNPADPRLIVQKRITWLGWTFNFAHWQSYVILTLLILILTVGNKLFH